jgi:hypothetical protein
MLFEKDIGRLPSLKGGNPDCSPPFLQARFISLSEPFT